MKRNSDLQQRRQDATARGVSINSGFFVERAFNASLWDVEGREYVDFAAGIAVLNTGHSHPRIVAAVKAQADRFLHICYQVAGYESAVDLAERLNEIAPMAGPLKTAFFTTGAEAVENAIKIARAHTGRSGVISFTGAFHGRTLMGMALTGKTRPYKVEFGVLPAGFYHAPFPSESDGVTVEDSLRGIEQIFKADIAPEQVAAIIVEPVQGEGGFNPAPRALLQGIRDICNRHGIVFIADEIQSGFGRTGQMFAMHHHGIEPDLITIAKSLGGGMPLSAVCGRAPVMDAARPGGLGGTYAANPLSVAAAHAVLDVLQDEQLCARAAVLGTRLREHLESLRGDMAEVHDVRGLGSMVAIEFRDAASGAPLGDLVGRIQKEALRNGLVILTCGQYGNALRFLYPLTIDDATFARGIEIFKQAVRSVVASDAPLAA